MPGQEEYVNMEEAKHVLKRPENYIGGMAYEESNVYLWDKKLERIVDRNVKHSKAFLQTLYEPLSNVVDNAHRSLEQEKKMNKFVVDFTETSIRMWNNGATIPVRPLGGSGVHKDKYIPHVMMGYLRSGSNFNDEKKRKNSGRNGYGVKLTNIFSHRFKFTTQDAENKKLYTQEWRENMSVADDPEVKKKSGAGFTELEWEPDFVHFGLEKFDETHQAIFMRMLIEASMSTGIKIVVNGDPIHIKTQISYVKLYEGENRETIKMGDENLTLIICGSENPNTVSFVNGINTPQGGAHVKACVSSVFSDIRDLFATKDGTKIQPSDMTRYFSIYVWASVDNPEFDRQTKTELIKPKVKPPVYTKSVLNKIKKWEVARAIADFVKSKEIGEFADVAKKKQKKRRVSKKFEHAVLAGRKPEQCALIVCEGDSAMGFAMAGISKPFKLGGKTYQGQQQIGLFATKGKIMNVAKASAKQLKDNEEVQSLITGLGLVYGLDYTDDKNFNTLNYHVFIVLVDADTDGSHIAGLILNFFKTLFPSLLKRKNFICMMHTPVVHIKVKGVGEKVYYSYAKFMLEASKYKDKITNMEYSKGLGSLDDEQVRQYYGEYFSWYVNDEEAFKSIDKAFDDSSADLRKQWIADHDPEKVVDIGNPEKPKGYITERNITRFIDDELINHAIENCGRSLPSVFDGWKTSQRMIYFTITKLKRNTKATRIKVAQLGGAVSSTCPYHHGEVCLYNTIGNMAQNYVGTNNLWFLVPNGQFGSRLMMGKDMAQPRYIHTYRTELGNHVFPAADNPILKYEDDEGSTAQPLHYMPIVPMVLINGANGIGTGWSTTIPQFNPLDVLNSVRKWIELYKKNTPVFQNIGDSKLCLLPELVPWYRGFKGTITQSGENRYLTEGILTRVDQFGNEIDPNEGGEDVYTYKITELPIGKATKDYTFFLEDLEDAGYLQIRGKNCTKHTISYTIDTTKRWTPKTLKLQSTLATSNMVCIDEKGRIRKYDTVQEIIDYFCHARLQAYRDRTKHLVKSLAELALIIKNKIRFIKAVNSEEIVVKGKNRVQLIEILTEQKYDPDPRENKYNYLLNISIDKLCVDGIDALTKEYDEIKGEIKRLKKTAPEDIWAEELDGLEVAIKKFYEFWEAEFKKDDPGEEKVMKKMTGRVANALKKKQEKAAEKKSKQSKK